MSAINKNQFSLQSMFVATSISAVLIVVAQLGAGYFPSLMVVALVLSLVAGAIGFAFISTACLISISILLTIDKGASTKEDLGKCGQIAMAGSVAFIPLFAFLFLLPFAI